LGAADIESLERSTVAAVAPPEVLELAGWLAPFDNGTIGRARSAAPLRHDLDAAAVDDLVDAYRARGLPPAFRIADIPAFDGIREALARHGLTGQQPTVMMVGDVARLAAFSDGPARILDRPDGDWAAVFLGEGFDPADGAHRVAVLSRSPGAVYGAAGEGRAQAVGVASFGYGWAGVHGMRTAPAARGRGHAGAILAALGRQMQARGVERVFLQVEAANPARRIYDRAGFRPVWTYRYWREP
jgi:ribosomal protein S18 acetylase RimI-like enzyme